MLARSLDNHPWNSIVLYYSTGRKDGWDIKTLSAEEKADASAGASANAPPRGDYMGRRGLHGFTAQSIRLSVSWRRSAFDSFNWVAL
jgi:hypothetical protein